MNALDRIFAEKTAEMAAIYRHVEPERGMGLCPRDLWETSLLIAAIALAVWIFYTGVMAIFAPIAVPVFALLALACLVAGLRLVRAFHTPESEETC